MTRYELLVFLHIAAAIIWVGSGFLFQVLGIRAVRPLDPARAKMLVDESIALATRLFIPASMSVLVLGVLLVLDGPWSFGDLWVAVGLAGYAATFLTGLFVIKPLTEKIGTLMERDGGMSDAALAEVRRLFLVGRVDLMVLFVVVADMTLKPTTDDVGALVVMAAAVAVAAAASIWLYRSSAQATPVREAA